jgi:hypothetical protein
LQDVPLTDEELQAYAAHLEGEALYEAGAGEVEETGDGEEEAAS